MVLNTRSKSSFVGSTSVVTASITAPISLLAAAVSTSNSSPTPMPAAGVPVDVDVNLATFVTVFVAAESCSAEIVPVTSIPVEVVASFTPEAA